MKTRTLTYITVGMILAAAIMVSYWLVKPISTINQRSLPVFIGEELIIKEAAPAKTVVIKTVKTQVTPAPQPKAVAPFPIFPPKLTYQVLPQYPATALEKGLEGTVLLSIYVGTSGVSEKIENKVSSGMADLDQAAISAVSQWKFEPATQGPQALASWFEVPVSFKIN